MSKSSTRRHKFCEYTRDFVAVFAGRPRRVLLGRVTLMDANGGRFNTCRLDRQEWSVKWPNWPPAAYQHCPQPHELTLHVAETPICPIFVTVRDRHHARVRRLMLSRDRLHHTPAYIAKRIIFYYLCDTTRITSHQNCIKNVDKKDDLGFVSNVTCACEHERNISFSFYLFVFSITNFVNK